MAHAFFQTALGRCGIAWEEAQVTGFALPPVSPGYFANSADDRSSPPPEWIAAIIARVRKHLEGNAEDFADLRYDFSRVTPFQREVYEAALQVKSGETRTYGWLAEQTGRAPGASRAVGSALGQNPWPLLVPCHRFLGANGKMTGFSAPGGVATKRKLLALEGAELLAED